MIDMLYLFPLLWFWYVLGVYSQSSLEFSIQPKNVTVREGSTAILNCQVKNTAGKVIIIQWHKGREGWITNYKNKPYVQLSNKSLYFPNVTKMADDAYFCAAILVNTKERLYSRVVHIRLAYINQHFNRNPARQSAREFNTVLLTCISGASFPLANIQWEKDGQLLSDKHHMAQSYIPNLDATSGSLKLPNVTLGDAGYYSCVATNPMLVDMPRRSQKALVLVLPTDDKPRIEVHPVNKVSPIDQPFQMECVIVGVPPPVIYWIHDGINVTNTTDGSRLVFLNGTLSISSLAIKDGGEYSCVGFNDKGLVKSSNVSIYVAYIKHGFNKNPENSTVVNGTRFEMVCEPPDHRPNYAVSFKWYKNYRAMSVGARVRISSSGSLVFDPVLKSDEGNYLCEATNTFIQQLRTSTLAYLTVHVPPYFVSTPSSQIIILHHQLRLSCESDGSPSPAVTWYHGNRLLSNSTRLTTLDDGSLTLTNVEASDAGVYKCLIWNIVGNRTADAKITVYVPPNVTVIPSNTSAVLGTGATFFCQFHGNPPPAVTWSFSQQPNGNYLPLGDPTRFIPKDRELFIANVTEQDSGWFNCTGQNEAGFQSFAAYLNVFVPARLTKSLSNITVNESDTVGLTCGSYGNPEPTISWSKDGALLVPNNRTSITYGTMQIQGVVKSDTGVYSCLAKNNFGNESSSAYMTVQVSPTIHSVLGPSRVQWKTTVSFHCVSDGVPKPRIVWLKDGDSITYSERISSVGAQLVITSTGHGDTANYTCEASNIVGLAKMNKQLIIEVPPNPPINLQVHNVSSTSLHVQWSTGFDGHSPIISFRLETRTESQAWRNVTDSATTAQGYTIKHLRPYSEYSIRVYAKNKIGWSLPSGNISVFTKQDAPSFPVNLTCIPYNATSVHLTWREPRQPNGVLSQYKVSYKKRIYKNSESFVISSSLQRIVHGLDIYTVYDFRVQASTKNGSLWGNHTSYTSCRTREAAPGAAPGNVSLTAVACDVLLASWNLIPANSANGIVRSYYVQYKETSEELYSEISVPGNQTRTLNITGLRPWTEYAVRVSAFTVDKGPWGVSATARTFESEPSGPPTNISVEAVTSGSLMVSWSAPLVNQRNGLILGYTIMIYQKDDLVAPSLNITTNQTTLTIPGLSIYTVYVVEIKAFTSVGHGPFSHPIKARTLESYPGLVGDVSVKIANNSILATWTPPRIPNGIITAYSVHYTSSIAFIVRVPGSNTTTVAITTRTRNVTTRPTSMVISGIVGNVTYSLCVAARTSVGYGKCSKAITFKTNFTLPITPTPLATTPVFLPSIVNDHLPLIAGISTVAGVLVIIMVACFFLRRKNRKDEEEKAQRTYNFRSHALSMASYGGSSIASRGPINGYSMDTGSLPSRTSDVSPSGYHQTSLGRLRNTPLHLGSDASSYDDAYSSVDEIGVDSTLFKPTPHHKSSHSAVNPLYADLHQSSIAGESSTDSYYAVNPIYDSASPRQQDPETGPPTPPIIPSPVFYPQGNPPEAGDSSFNPYERLIVPPPPSFSPTIDNSEYSDVGAPYSYDNEATDF